MREYGKVSPTFWTGNTGKRLRSRGTEAVVVAFYLMTAPGSNMLGLYYQPILFMAHETGLGLEGASKGLAECISEGFCHYDQLTEMVWVTEMAAWQIGEKLKASDNRCLGIQRDYETLQPNAFLGEFFDRYQSAFHLSERRESEGVAKPLTKPLASKEQEKEQEIKKEQPQGKDFTLTTPDEPKGKNGKATKKPVDADPICQIILEAYHAALPACQAVRVLNPKRKRRMLAANKLAGDLIKQQGLGIGVKTFWRDYFAECSEDDWMAGRVPYAGNPSWKQNLDTLLEEDRFAKVMDKALAGAGGDP